MQGKCSKINNASCCGRIDFEEQRNELDENWLVSSKNLPISNCWIPTKNLDFSNICHFVHIAEHQFSLIFKDYAQKKNKSYWRVKPFSIEFQSFWTDLFKSQLGVSTEKRRRSLSNRSRCFRYENERDLKIRSKLQLFNGKKWGKEKNWQSSRKIIYEKWKWCLRRMKKNENSDCRNPQRINKNCERGEEKVECAIRI